MNRERENGICLWAAIIIMAALTCLVLMGCATEAVMPLKPNDPNGWDYSERDGKVTLSPSVATNCPFKAHFFIRENKIVWV